MFNNIDQKIQSLAKVYFGIQVFVAIVTAIATMAVNSDLWWAALLGCFAYIFIGLVTAWSIYAVGLHLENQGTIIDAQRKILHALRENGRAPHPSQPAHRPGSAPFAPAAPQASAASQVPTGVEPMPYPIQTSEMPAQSEPSVHRWRCPHCGVMTATSPCEYCGQ